MKKVLITVGPIPARLDSVKFITNRFKGGLALKTAHYLAEKGLDVTIVGWKFTQLDTKLKVIHIEDVMDYYEKVLAFQADAYILAGAVANLMPSNPYEGKFPSHKYKVGEKFNVEFEIAPRVIDEVKKKYPTAALIGYKLYDGTDEDLIASAKKTLFDSKANLVFANHPAWAKDRKYALTQDGALYQCSFDEHNELLYKLISSKFYSTKIVEECAIAINDLVSEVEKTYPTCIKDERVYGTFAVRNEDGKSFFTTTRGKRKSGVHGESGSIVGILNVDHESRVIHSTAKATLNAPLLSKVFELNTNFNIIVHGHDLIGKVVHNEYEFAGTDGDLLFASKMNVGEEVLLPHHGYIVGFETIEQYRSYIRGK
jgi:DNA / pantothenate metabolism flavoprotein